jgi:hypothetical protein
MADNENDQKPGDFVGGEGVLQTDIAQDDTYARADMNLIRRAISEGWEIPQAKKAQVVDRLLEIAQKKSCQVSTKTGIVQLDGPADSNAVKAASVLVAMTGERQRDIHAQDKNDRIDTGKATDRVAVDPVVLERPILPQVK